MPPPPPIWNPVSVSDVSHILRAIISLYFQVNETMTTPKCKVTVLKTDSWTLNKWSLPALESLERVVLYVHKTEPLDFVSKLRGRPMANLCIQRQHHDEWCQMVDYLTLCDILHNQFPLLTSLSFKEVHIGNTKAKAIMKSLRYHPQLQILRYKQCIYSVFVDKVRQVNS